MSQWAHEHPEEMTEIARLPLSQQNEALRGAMTDPLAAADHFRKEQKESPAYSAPPHKPDCECDWCQG